MTGKTHFIAGSAMGLLALNLASAGMLPLQTESMQAMDVPIVVASGVVGGMAPDLDIHTSKISQQLPAISKIIEFVFGHRTLLHSPIFYLALAQFLYTRSGISWVYWFVVPFLMGAFSHLFLDMFNKAGIPLLYPYKKRFWLMKCESNGPVEKMVRMLFLLLVCVMCIGCICNIIGIQSPIIMLLPKPVATVLSKIYIL